MAIAVQTVKDAPEKKIITKQRRVVVIGMGVVTSPGHDLDTFYSNLLQGKSCVSEIKSFDCKDFPTKIASEIQLFSIDGWVAPKLSKQMDKSMLYMLIAGKKALAMGGMKVFNDAVEALRISYRKMNPFRVPFETTNMGSAMMAMDLGWMGPNFLYLLLVQQAISVS